MYRKRKKELKFIISDCGEGKSFYIVNRVQSTEPLQQIEKINRRNSNESK